MFYLTGDIERYGTGFIRIREFLKEYQGSTITVEEMGNFFKAELRLPPANRPPNRETSHRFGDQTIDAFERRTQGQCLLYCSSTGDK